jgi:diguanylate cyclase (GGDEF)-like protein
VRRWALWSLPRHVVLFVLLAESGAVVITAATANTAVHQRDLVLWGILALGSVVHLEAVRSIERVREGLRHNAPYVDLKSVWTFAAVLVLPTPLTVGLVVLTFVHLRSRLVRMPVYRCIYSCATVILATHAAAAVLTAGLPTYPGLPGTAAGVFVIVLAAMLRWFVNHGMVVAVILLSSPRTPGRTALGIFSNNIVEVAAVSLGAVTALAAVTQPWFIMLILPTLVVLHRALLLHQYEVAARTDEKTGLANAVHWSETARLELRRAERDKTSVGILMLDIDHFKEVNDTHGHLVGDAVLKVVADTLRDACRPHDLVGRWGGEEFTVLLPGVTETTVVDVAERLRRLISVQELPVPPENPTGRIKGLTASIGAVTYPATGPALEDLLLAADKALYEAKANGRNKVMTVPHLTS